MLIRINPILTGDLLKVLSDMGHGDEIVVADGNFSATGDSTRRPPIWVPSADTIEVVRAILNVFPVDESDGSLRFIAETASEAPHYHTSVAAQDFTRLALDSDVEPVSSDDFHLQARTAYAIVATTDPRHYACFILRKGVLPDPTQSP